MMANDYGVFKQAVEEERFRCERLEEQINDLTELHQHEVTNIKQVRHFTSDCCLSNRIQLD